MAPGTLLLTLLDVPHVEMVLVVARVMSVPGLQLLIAAATARESYSPASPAPTGGPQLKQVPLPVLQDVRPAQVAVLEPRHLAVGVALAGEGEHQAAGHVLAAPGTGGEAGHCTGGVHHEAGHLAGLQPQYPVT